MTAKEKRHFTTALRSIERHIHDIASYLHHPNLTLEDLEDMHAWTVAAHENLTIAVDAAREYSGIGWQAFGALAWARSDVARVRDALHFYLYEQPRND